MDDMFHFSLSNEQDQALQQALSEAGANLDKSTTLAKAVKSLSDQYTQKSKLDNIWVSEKNRAAYMAYFMPLNTLRAQAVIKEAMAVDFFKGLNFLMDFGSGIGAFDWALKAALPDQFIGFDFIEKSKEARHLHKNLQELLSENSWGSWFDRPNLAQIGEKSLITFSYSLNELDSLPAWAMKSEAICIIEPSTQVDGRKLMAIRQELIDKGFSIWAPCPHQLKCPLLTQSKKDWCHNRVFVDLPDWMKKIEDHLPMKNRSITYSYLLARKTPPPQYASQSARIIGDTLKEKGKSRQMVCRGEDREFLSWLKKEKNFQMIPRGSFVELPADIEQKGSEIRVHNPVTVVRS